MATPTCAASDAPLEEGAVSLTSPDPDGFVGTTVADLGDLDGDGHEEIAVAESFPGVEPPDVGRVYLVCGPVTEDMSLDHACAEVQPDDADAGFGHVVAGVGDWDGDGVGDFAAGDPTNQEDVFDGAAYVLDGSAALVGETAPLFEVRGASEIGQAGSDLTSADLDGDGVSELVVASFDGAFGFASRSEGMLTTADAGMGVEGHIVGFVESGDLDGDGYADLVTTHLVPYGFAIYRGPFPDLRPMETYDAWIDPWDEVFPSLEVTGDLDGDALPDVAVGWDGSVYVYSAAHNGTQQPVDAVAEVTGEGAWGWSLAGVGDLTGDGSEDLLVGALNLGVYVLSGDGPETKLGDTSFMLESEGSGVGWSVAGLPAEGECGGAVIGAPVRNTVFVWRGG